MIRVVFTCGAMGTLREACKRWRFIGAFAFAPEGHRRSSQLRENGVAAGPDIVQHDAEPQESHNGQLTVDRIRNHRSAPHRGMVEGHFTQF
jgi:hypothetical protein